MALTSGSGSLASAYQNTSSQQNNLYQGAISRFNQRMNTASAGFAQGVDTLKGTEDIYKPGGEFTTSKFAALEKATQEGQSAARFAGVQSGMWSGTNMQGMLASAKEREGIEKSNIESERLSNITNLRTAIANLQAGKGQTIAAMTEPGFADYYNQAFGPFMAARSASQSSTYSFLSSMAGIKSQEKMQTEKLNAEKNSSSKLTTH